MPAFRAVSAGNSVGSQTGISIDVPLPSGTQSGDQLVLGICVRSASGGSGGWTPDPNWVLIEEVADANGFGYFYRAEYGTDITGAGPWNFNSGAGDATTNKWAYACVALDGSIATGYLTGDAMSEPGTTTDHATPTISPGSDSVLVAIVGDRSDGGSTWTWPAGWTERSDERSDTGTNAVSCSSATYDTEPASAGSYSVTATATISESDAYTGIFAFTYSSGGNNYTENPADSLGATDTIPLLPPEGLTADVLSSTEVDLSWRLVAGADSYDLERDAAVISTGQAGATFSDTELAPATQYTYRVRSRRTTSG